MKRQKPRAAIDRQLDHWANTDAQHKAEVKRLEELHKHDLDWFDLEAYQRMVAKFR